jgi:PPE-repeat protein
VVAAGGLSLPGGRREHEFQRERASQNSPTEIEYRLSTSVRSGGGRRTGQARARRRERAGLRGHSNEFMDMNFEADPDWGAPTRDQRAGSTVASDRGAGTLGFAGTVAKDPATRAAGLTTLADDELGGGPSVPMVPHGWEND